MNINKVRSFGKLCCRTQKELKRHLFSQLRTNGYNVINGDGYLYAKGDIPILLTAHMDTVHKKQVTQYVIKNSKGKTVISAKDGIGGDDRCGIFMILEIIRSGLKPYILFCEDEEIGGIGSNKFVMSKYIDDLTEMKYLIELDRANANDAVFYDCENPEFTSFITETTGYKEAFGSFSDISHLSPACKVASVNLSCGYYKAHTTSEYVVFEEMENTIEVVKKLLNTECEQFEYIEAPKFYGYGSYFRNYGYYDNYYDNYFSKPKKFDCDLVYLEVSFKRNGEEIFEAYEGESKSDCWVTFFTDNPDICYNDVIDYMCY